MKIRLVLMTAVAVALAVGQQGGVMRAMPMRDSALRPGARDGGSLGAVLPEACPDLARLKHVPQDVIDEAIQSPETVSGWLTCSNPNVRCPSVYNSYRRMLWVRNPNLTYNPISNGIVFRSGCP